MANATIASPTATTISGRRYGSMRAKRLAEGVPLPDDTWAAIVETARSVGLDEQRIQQATM